MAFNRKTKANEPGDRGVSILTTQFSIWYWKGAEKKIFRYIPNASRAVEEGILFDHKNNLAGATGIAANREYRRLNNERE